MIMKVIFLNLWNFTNQDFAISFIKDNVHDTDVFCFQEAYEKAKWFCKDLLSDFFMIADYKYISDSDDFPLATYTKKDIRVVANRTLLLDLPGTGLGIHTQLEVGGVVYQICNVHGISKPGDKLDNELRISQSKGLIREFSVLEGLKIIGGDLNLEYNTQSVALFEENGYRNLIKDFGVRNTRNKYVWDKHPGSKQYFSDYVFVSENVVVQNFLVPESEASDHLPMILTT